MLYCLNRIKGFFHIMSRQHPLSTHFFVLLCVLLLLAPLGCKRKNPPPLSTNWGDGAGTQQTGAYDPYSSGGGFADDRGGAGVTGLPGLNLDDYQDGGLAPGLNTVYFPYDDAGLDARAQATLQENASRMRASSNVIYQIGGHCDERGTQEYNMALGERRALSVRDYLIRLGVPGDRMVTISFGEEMPAAYGSNEAAWSQNRRAEFRILLPR